MQGCARLTHPAGSLSPTHLLTPILPPPPQAPLLEGLRLGRLPALSRSGAEALGRLARLARLDLSGCCLSDASLAAALGGLRGLKECDLSMAAHLGDATLAQLAAACPQLSKLDLTGCERFRWALC